MLGFGIPCALPFGEIEIPYHYEVVQVRIADAKIMVCLSCHLIAISILRHLDLLSLLAISLIARFCRHHHRS